MELSILMPINEKFLDVFDEFMNPEQKNKIRANNVRQYVEGIIDLLLKNKIESELKPTENYQNISWKKKLDILENHYDKDIAITIREIFRIGGEGSHFKGEVSNEEIQGVIIQASHLVEDIFVKYFIEPEHQFGTENIYYFFSMLPLDNRIYILEHVYAQIKNIAVVDRLSLAYIKAGKDQSAANLLKEAYAEQIIDKKFMEKQTEKLGILRDNLSTVYELNKDYDSNINSLKATMATESIAVVGLPTSKDVFDVKRAYDCFKPWFETYKDKYPEFINLFMCLMARDSREYN